MTSADSVVEILTAAGGSGLIVAGLAGWLGKVLADRLSQVTRLRGEVDVDLRKRRIDAYLPLWRLTSLLPKWPRAHGVTYEDLYQLSLDIRTWYFETGGIFLSRSTQRKAYVPLQDAIAALSVAGKKGPLSESDYDAIRDRCSTLRTRLSSDVESRREGAG